MVGGGGGGRGCYQGVVIFFWTGADGCCDGRGSFKKGGKSKRSYKYNKKTRCYGDVKSPEQLHSKCVILNCKKNRETGKMCEFKLKGDGLSLH